MNNNTRINLIVLIIIVLISLLFFIIPITPAFIISYFFTIISILMLIKAIKTCEKKNTDIPQIYANIQVTFGYIISTVIFSLIVCIFFSSSTLLPLVIHLGILGIFSIILLVIGAGNKHISKLHEPTEERKRFIEQKKKYWK